MSRIDEIRERFEEDVTTTGDEKLYWVDTYIYGQALEADDVRYLLKRLERLEWVLETLPDKVCNENGCGLACGHYGSMHRIVRAALKEE